MATLEQQRASAKADGYTDAEIDSFLAVPPQAAQSTGSASSRLLPIGVGAAALGAGGYAASRITAAVRAMPGVARAGARMIPGVGKLMDAADLVNALRGNAAPAASTATAQPSAASASTPAEKLPAGVTRVTEADIAKHKELKSYEPGQEITRKRLEEIKSPGSASSRTPGRVVGEIKPREPAPASAPQAPATAARHEVQYYSESQGKFVPIEDMPISHLRNAMNKLHSKLLATKQPSPVTQKQFEAIRDEVTFRAKQAGELTVPGPTKAGMGSAQSRVPAARAPAAALEDQLAASIEAAQAARGIAATTAERQTIMNGLRGMAPPAIQALLMLLGTGDVEAQGNAARELATPPAIRKALAHQSQGS